MKVRLKMAWGQWSKGHVIPEMPGGQARTMIARGIVEEVKDDEPIAVQSPVNRMVKPRAMTRKSA